MPYALELYKTVVTAGVAVDLSPLFLTEGVAPPSYHNVSWSLIIQDEGTEYYWGGVTAKGLLDQGNAPAGFKFTFPYSCNMTAQLIVYFEPDPDCPCCTGADDSGQQSCPASAQSSNSVELATGKFVFQKDLLSIFGTGSGGWAFGLNYKSNFDIEGILGRNFAYPQYMYLQQLTGGNYFFQNDVQLVTNQLSRAIFDYNDDESYTTPVGNNTGGTLTRINAYAPSERLILTSADGTVTTFFGFNYSGGDWNPGADVSVPAPGQIESIVDRYGNQQILVWGNTHTSINEYVQTVYDGDPQLLSVTDSYGRSVTYNYYGSEGNYRLKQITDFQGRQLNFQYDSDDHLIAAITPSILKAAPGNTFPGGTAYVFQYDTDNADPARRDDLIRIWYPNQTQPYLNVETRSVDVAAVYASAAPRYQVTYGQNSSDADTYGKVLTETLGDPQNEVGGTATFDYTTCSDDLPTNIIDDSDAGEIVSRTTYADRNGNSTIYDFNAYWTVSRLEVQLNRSKNSLELAVEYPNPPYDPGSPYPNFAVVPPYVTWTKYNAQNQPLTIIYPEGNSTEYAYETGEITVDGEPQFFYVARRGLLLSESRFPGNSLTPALPDLPIHSRAGSNGQTILTKRYFYDPIFNQLCAVIDERGNSIDISGDYFTPQNGNPMFPIDGDCSRYATLYTFDYQKDTADTVINDPVVQNLLGFPGDPDSVQALINFVNGQMVGTDGSGGLPNGFQMGLGDINADGTGEGMSNNATHLGNVVQIIHPAVSLVGDTTPTQTRIELFTVNLRGQITTATDAEGNLTVTTRYPENDPEGSGQNISSTLSTQQYGLVREIHRDANPDDVMSLVGASGDLVAFVPGTTGTNTPQRTNTPGIYQDLVTRYEGSSSGSAGCVTCGYDAMGNVLNETDPRGFTTIYDRNEMGEIYRVTSPAPYNYRVETFYDANRNVIQVDTEDWQVQYNSADPTSAGYGTFTPTGSGTTAHVPMMAGPGGAVRPGWFSNLMSYDLLDNKIEDDIDATGSLPANLVTKYQYDANQNLIKIVKPEGNTVEYDYDERDLKIVERVGYFLNPTDPTDPQNSPGAVTAYSYDGNKNLLNVIGPVDHNPTIGGTATRQTVYIVNAFGSGSMLTATGDWILANTYDGFDRVITTTDAVGGVTNNAYDPASTLIQKQIQGTIGGTSPTDRTGSNNVLLANAYLRYDEARRLYEEQKDVFLSHTGTEALLLSGRTATHTGGGLATNSTLNDHTDTVTLTGTTPGLSYVLTRTVYDRSGRVVATLSDNTGQTDYSYDGANRQVVVTDPLGNIIATQYDGNNNPIQVTRTEICTITSPTVANEIFVSFAWFDCLNRPVVAGTQGADGCLTSNLNLCCPWQGLPSTLYSLMGYDSRGKRSTVTDPKLNVVVSLYDGASRLIETQQEMRQNGDGRNAPAPNQTFLAPGGMIRTEYIYDGNSRLIELIDDRGASTIYTYDLLDRLNTKTLADGSISIKTYDLSSCLTFSTDENGSTFTFTYDALSRQISISINPALGVGGETDKLFVYDGLSRIVMGRDLNFNFYLLFTYDSIGRLLEELQYLNGFDGYVTHSAWTSLVATTNLYPSDDDTINPVLTLNNTYDLLYRRTSVTATSPSSGAGDTVAWEFFGSNRIVETNWGGGSLIATQMNNARTHSAVQSTVALPAWGNISTDQLGYDGVGRMIAKRYMTGGISEITNGYSNTTALVGYTTSFDRTGNKLYERHLEAENRSHLYQPFNSDGSFGVGYDSANRLRQYQRGVLSNTTIPYRVNAGASIATPTTLPGADQVRTYDLDGLGNWKASNFTLVGSGGSTVSTAEIQQHNYVNEITNVKDTTGGTSTTTLFAYDHGNNASSGNPVVQQRGNGNVVNDGLRIYKYDPFNRVIQINRASDNAELVIYRYDSLGRRILKIINDLGGGLGGLTGDIPAQTIYYFYDGQQLIMELPVSSTNTWSKLYVWGQYIDELLFLAVSSGRSSATTYRVLSDLLYRSTALVTTSNVITEAYDTDAYGNTLCYSGPGTDDLWFTDDDVRTNNPINPTIFTGRQYDLESQIYYYRARYYSPQLGRFISRDPLKRAELRQGPNLYWYVGNSPINRKDPSGLIMGCTEKPETRQFAAGSGWNLVTFELTDMIGTNFQAAYHGVKGEWSARVCVDCCCLGMVQNICSERKYISPEGSLKWPVVGFNVTVTPGPDAPDGTELIDLVALIASIFFEHTFEDLPSSAKLDPNGPDPAMVNEVLDTLKPKSPSDGQWISDPCQSNN